MAVLVLFGFAAFALLPGRASAQTPCSITGPNVTCEDVKLCGPEGNFSYEWDLPGGGSSSERCVDATVGGTYTLVVTDLSNGAKSDPCSHDLEFRDAPPCGIGGKELICEGTSTELCGPEGDFTYEWSGPNGFEAATRCVTVSDPGTYELTVTDPATGCFTKCEHVLKTETCGGDNCPRSPGFWKQQCEQRGNGSTKFTVEQMTEISERVDELSDFFDWADGTDFSFFCVNINNNGNQLRRHFAAVLAGVATGQLGLIANNGDEITIDLDTPIDCDGVDAETIGELIDETDDALIANDTGKFEDLKNCLEHVDNGIDIGPVCTKVAPRSSATTGRMGRLGLPSLGSVDGGAIQLYRAFPNPFKATTQFAYAVAVGGESVDLGVYDIAGRLVQKLVTGFQPAGRHLTSWDGRDQAGSRVNVGVYFIRGRVGQFSVGSSVLLVE